MYTLIMPCSNCGDKLTPIILDEVWVDHCPSCGCTFFDKNELEKITVAGAKELAKLRKNDSISGDIKRCPKDKMILTRFISASVPSGITLLYCPNCEGIFAYPDDLVRVKTMHQKMETGLTSHTTTQLTVRSLFTYGLVLLVALTVVTYMSPLLRPAQAPRATADTCNLTIAKRDNLNTVYCTTRFPFTSEAIFFHSITQEEIKRMVNQKPQTLHLLTVPDEDIAASPDVCVKFLLTADKTKLETPCVPFVVSP